MNVLIAPNSMKGSLDAPGVAAAVAAGFREASPVFNLRLVPIADGGDFTGEILRDALGARDFRETVAGPLGAPVDAVYGIAGHTAVIEMASASGLRLLGRREYLPGEASSLGTGELIRAALARGCRRIIVGLGGSATVDGGIGLLAGMGFSFYDASGNSLPPLPSSLRRVSRLEAPGDLPQNVEYILLADVANPLLGEEGAARVFGPQKGAGPVMIRELETGLTHWITLLEELSGKPLRHLPGIGAAGGVASGLVALCGATLVRGAEFLFDHLNMERHLSWADWIITGEGRCDLRGGKDKGPGRLAIMAAAATKPVTSISGSFDSRATGEYAGVFSISNGAETLQELTGGAAERVRVLSYELARVLLAAFPGAAGHHRLLTEAGKSFAENDIPRALILLDEGDAGQLSSCWHLRGTIYQKLQQWGDAINCFSKSLELDQGNKKSEAGLAMVRQILAFRNPDLLNP